MAKTILLADDSVTIRKVVELTFMDQDYKVVAVGNGDEALARLAEIDPDLLIADVHMPGADGYEVCRRTKESRPGLPVLLLVGTFEPFDEQQAAAASADGHLKKPFDSQDLLAQVESLVGGGRPGPAAPETAEVEVAAEAQPLEMLDLERPELAQAEVSTVSEAAAETKVEPAAATPFPFAAPAAGSPVAAPPAAAPPRDAAAAEPPIFELASATAEEGEVGGAEETTPVELVAEEPSPREEAEELFRLEPLSETGTEPPPPPPEPIGPGPAGLAEAGAGADVAPPVPLAEPAPAAPSVPTESSPAVVAGNGQPELSDGDVDRIARKVVELIGDKALREVAWEVVPDLAELIIKERIRELESQVE